MISASHKSKQYLLLALKILILAITFGYIYSKINSGDSLDLETFLATIGTKSNALLFIPIFLFLSFINWSLEILKWQTIVSEVQSISLNTAKRQCLTALTVSLATPNRIGDYGAKAMFYENEKRKKILLLNFFSNTAQLAVTCVFGLIGLIYCILKFSISFSMLKVGVFVATVTLLIILGYRFKEKKLLLKGLTISNVLQFFSNINRSVKLKVLFLSILRYVVFSSCFLMMLYFFVGDFKLPESIFLVFAMYLLVSVIPSIFVFDVLVRGGVAVWLFSLIGLPELPVLCTVLGMWILNFAIPAFWGSFYVMGYKTVTV